MITEELIENNPVYIFECSMKNKVKLILYFCACHRKSLSKFIQPNGQRQLHPFEKATKRPSFNGAKVCLLWKL